MVNFVFIDQPAHLQIKKYKVTMSQEEREELDAISSKGKQKVQNLLYSFILLAYDEGGRIK